MHKILFVMNVVAIITAVFFWAVGINYFKNDEYNKRGIKCILGATRVTAICIVIWAVLFVPTFFPI